MKKILVCGAACLLLVSGVSFAQTANGIADIGFGFTADRVQGTQNHSIQWGTTFGSYENEFDFFYQPWEIADIMWGRTNLLGNVHEDGEEFKYMYWSQLSNNPQPVTVSTTAVQNQPPGGPFVALDTPLNVLTAAALFKVKDGGNLAISASVAADNRDINNPNVPGGATNGERSRSFYELYAAYGAQAGDNLAWGVGLILGGGNDERKGLFFNPANVGNTYEDTVLNWNLEGGVKFRQSERMNWNFSLHGGKPNIENTTMVLPATMTRLELDGTNIGVGVDLNLFHNTVDWEFDFKYDYTDWDVSTSDTTVIGNSNTTNVWLLDGRLAYQLGRVKLIKRLKFEGWNGEFEITRNAGQLFDNQKRTAFIIEPSISAILPVNDWFSFLGGAAYNWYTFEIENQNMAANPADSSELQDAHTYMRLGFEVALKSVTMDFQWRNGNTVVPLTNNALPSNQELNNGAGRDQVNNNEFAFGISWKI